jgi:hypothetical protein
MPEKLRVILYTKAGCHLCEEMKQQMIHANCGELYALEEVDIVGDAELFTRYRRSLGIQDGEGRRSLVNFHSWRRWFVTKAVNAGQPAHIVALVVGHKEGRKGMTLGRYWQGADDEAMDGTRSWRGQIGAALSFSALGFAIASLMGPHGRACPTPEGSATLDLRQLFHGCRCDDGRELLVKAGRFIVPFGAFAAMSNPRFKALPKTSLT